ncbi:hypothetical protein JVT61DRAFT_12813 [Boletus reticuloceps]|uniref:Transcription initiation factor IIF subunit alpha n=1 Tax=Boletus reticuloceps TaxID=495285 RepID=A0A8I3AAV6_9AGAM|nr:hypothetical protein JVT61DRAFT_12813 [Boletus reticuloceps]
MPPKSAESLLFHKKKPVKKDPSGSLPSGTLPSPRKSATPRQQPTPPNTDDPEDSSKLPEGEFSEYKLMSSALNGWKYDVMKFDSRKPVDVSTWEEPIKLNRKDIRRQDSSSAQQVPVGPMLGSDGKPVIGSDGRMVMVDADGRPIANTSGEGSSKEKETKGKIREWKKEDVQEDTTGVQGSRGCPAAPKGGKIPMGDGRCEAKRSVGGTTRGGLQGRNARSFHACLLKRCSNSSLLTDGTSSTRNPSTISPIWKRQSRGSSDALASRWQGYKRTRIQSAGYCTADSDRALPQLHQPCSRRTRRIRRRGAAPLVHNAGQSRAPGGKALRTVNRGSQGAEQDEEGNVRPKREDDGEGHLDEQLFDEDVADDDEHEAADMDDEEAKELEERLKREYKLANKRREGYIDESEEEEDDSQLSKDGKSLKKLMRKLEKNVAYDSDEERNPYASSDENEEEEEPPLVSNEPAIQQQPQQVNSRSTSQQPATKPPTAEGSRAVSPAPVPSLGGHSIVAKRATSPRAPKTKSANVSRGNSPLSGVPGGGSRAISPAAGGVKGLVGSPTNASPNPANKRKADEVSGAGASSSAINGTNAPKPKKRKPLPTAPEGELEERMLIEWLQNTPNATTRACIQHFTPYLRSEAKKAKFTAMVKEVAQVKSGILILKSALRGESAATSPVPAP